MSNSDQRARTPSAVEGVVGDAMEGTASGVAVSVPGEFGAVRAKRPYKAPRILSCEPLEAAANVCDPLFNGKGDMTQCPLGASNS